ncbi:MAG: hypothetical protein J6K71_02440 [Clostridia bacterium]|nr:hypothetical protein [Clostridia bacterium]
MNDSSMRQLKSNDSAAFQKVLEKEIRKSFEDDLKNGRGITGSSATTIQQDIDADFASRQAKTKVTNAEKYATTAMASWENRDRQMKKDLDEGKGFGGFVSWGKQYSSAAGGYVKENAIKLTKPLVHQGKLTLQTYGDILLDNNFAKGLRDGDTKDEVYLRLFKGMTKKDADKAKDKDNKAKDNQALVSLQKEAFKQAFKEAMQESNK